MTLIYQVKKAVHTKRRRVKGGLLERKAWTRVRVGAEGNRRDSEREQQRAAKGTCTRKQAGEAEVCG